MSDPRTAALGEALVRALDALLPGACPVATAGVGPVRTGRAFDSALALESGASRWLLCIRAGEGFCARLLARMLGREPSPEEVDDMAVDALREFCNLLGGRIAGLVGEGGVELAIGVPLAFAAGCLGGWQTWQYAGDTFALALAAEEQETAA